MYTCDDLEDQHQPRSPFNIRLSRNAVVDEICVIVLLFL